MKIRIHPRVAIPAGIAVVFCALGILGVTKAFEYRVFDLFLMARKSPVELKKSITLVDFDDQSVEKAGTWPIGRDIMADGLMLLQRVRQPLRRVRYRVCRQEPRRSQQGYPDDGYSRKLQRPVRGHRRTDEEFRLRPPAGQYPAKGREFLRR